MSAGFERFAEQARLGGGIVPVTREVVLDGDTPVTAFAKLHRGRWGFLLESLEGGERWARYTFLATEPREVFRYRGRECSRWTASGGWTTVETDLAPLEHLGRTMRRHPPVVVPGLPRFTGGAVGFWGYDVVRTIESLPDAPPDDRDLPDAVVMVADTLLVLDNLFNRATVIASLEVPAGASGEELRTLYAGAESRIDEWLDRLAAPGTVQPLAIETDTAAPGGVLPLPRCPVPGRRAPDQGIHRRGRHLPDGAEPADRPRGARIRSSATAISARSTPRRTCTISTATTSTSSAARRRSWCGWRMAR